MASDPSHGSSHELNAVFLSTRLTHQCLHAMSQYEVTFNKHSLETSSGRFHLPSSPLVAAI